MNDYELYKQEKLKKESIIKKAKTISRVAF